MDFKSIISKIESIDGPIDLPKGAEQSTPIRLDEDTEFRVLAGLTPLSEELKKVGDTEKTHKGGTVTKTEKGIKHEKKDDYDGEDNSEPAQSKPSKAAKSAAEKKGDRELDKAEKAKSKDWQKRFGKDSVKKHSSESIEEASDKQKAAREKFLAMVDKKKGEKKEESVKEAKKPAKKEKKMDEAAKPDFLDMDKDGDKKEPMKKAVADKGGDKKDGKKGMSAKQEKYFGKKNESVKTSKKVVAESVEQSLTFRDMAKLVQESGGQQAIDPLDKELFAWATRVAQNKNFSQV